MLTYHIPRLRERPASKEEVRHVYFFNATKQKPHWKTTIRFADRNLFIGYVATVEDGVALADNFLFYAVRNGFILGEWGEKVDTMLQHPERYFGADVAQPGAMPATVRVLLKLRQLAGFPTFLKLGLTA